MIKKILFIDEYRKYISKKIPDIFSNMTRNYDVLILGDYGVAKKYTDKHDFDCSNYYRNFYTDYLVAQRYYSMLKKGGIIKIYINGHNKKYFSQKKISPFDYGFLHMVTCMEQEVKNKSIIHKINMMLNGLRLKKVTNKNRRKGIVKKAEIDQYKQLAEIKDFCAERNIKLEVMVEN